MSSINNPTEPQPKTSKRKRWFPLESNPELLNKYISKLGFDTSVYEFVDVYSTESWALEMIPLPVAAVVMLYPLTDVQETHRAKEESELKDTSGSIVSPDVWFMKQRIGNACGTIGVIHSLANIPEAVRVAAISPSSWLETFLESCPRLLDPTAKAEILEEDGTIEVLHDAASSDTTSQTDRGRIEDRIDTHFVAFVHVDGGLYELDGRKSGPIRHGDTSEMGLLGDACKVIEKFMARDPKELRFTITALAPKSC